jgi:hypothetical protein
MMGQDTRDRLQAIIAECQRNIAAMESGAFAVHGSRDGRVVDITAESIAQMITMISELRAVLAKIEAPGVLK